MNYPFQGQHPEDQHAGRHADLTEELTAIDRPARISGRAGLATIATAAMLAAAMCLAGSNPGALLTSVALCQLLAIVSWWWGGRAESLGFVVVGVTVAIAADAIANLEEPNPSAIAGVIAGGFGLAIITQLTRSIGRRKVAAALSAQLSITVVMVGLATIMLLVRLDDGTELARTAAFSTGVALALAHVSDLIVATPRVNHGVARGLPGLVVGTVAGVVGGAVFFTMIASDGVFDSVAPGVAGGIIGGVSALVSLLADLAVSYATVEPIPSELDSSAAAKLNGTHEILLATLGPIIAFAAVGPVGYLIAPMLHQW